jgi:hypothetical protein
MNELRAASMELNNKYVTLQKIFLKSKSKSKSKFKKILLYIFVTRTHQTEARNCI